jgi:hypothetical protein
LPPSSASFSSSCSTSLWRESTTYTSSPTSLSSNTSSSVDLCSSTYSSLCNPLQRPPLQRLQPAAKPGHQDLQAAHLGRDGPGLLLQPLITSSALAFLARSLVNVGQGEAKKTQVSDFQNGKALSHP